MIKQSSIQSNTLDNLIVSEPKDLATSLGNLTLLQMQLVDFAFLVASNTNNSGLYSGSMKDFLQIFKKGHSGNSYKRVRQAFENLKNPILNLKTGKVPFLTEDSYYSDGIMYFRINNEIRTLV